MKITFQKVFRMSFSSDNPLISNQIPISFDINPDEQDFDRTLMLYLRRMANATNTKEQGLYLLQETGNFQQWFTYLTGTSTPDPQQNRNDYRTTVDLVALNGGNIPAGTTILPALTTTTNPPAINGYLYPTRGFGGAKGANGISYFPSDPNVTVSFNSSTNVFTVINNTGVALTWLVFVIEYLKN